MDSVTDLSWAVDLEDGVEKHPDLCREAGRLSVLGSDHHLQLGVCRNGIERPTPGRTGAPSSTMRVNQYRAPKHEQRESGGAIPDKSRRHDLSSVKDTNPRIRNTPDVMTHNRWRYLGQPRKLLALLGVGGKYYAASLIPTRGIMDEFRRSENGPFTSPLGH